MAGRARPGLLALSLGVTTPSMLQSLVVPVLGGTAGAGERSPVSGLR